MIPAGSLTRRLPGAGAGARADPQCMRCGVRSPPSQQRRPVRGLMTAVCARGFGCAAAAGPAVTADEAVLAVLRDAGPLGHQGIGEALRARYGMALKRDALDKTLYRVGAARTGRGKYAAPEGLPGATPESETPACEAGVSINAATREEIRDE